ncbi:hypothetical protein ACFV3R_29985 [Streptomyces sp. NPDC059740]|uniref:hypothetical protein n=1 Tax=Streptomyces sp. NPDC059740 TaxID=3346926 RepID=UPI0036645C6D
MMKSPTPLPAATDPEGGDVGGVRADAEGLPSNWGRWGPEDRLGTLNLITGEVRTRAAAEVRTHPELAPSCPSPLHRAGLGMLGMPLVDVAEVGELASVCVELVRHTFLLALAPPRIHGLTGVPVKPLALF